MFYSSTVSLDFTVDKLHLCRTFDMRHAVHYKQCHKQDNALEYGHAQAERYKDICWIYQRLLHAAVHEKVYWDEGISSACIITCFLFMGSLGIMSLLFTSTMCDYVPAPG